MLNESDMSEIEEAFANDGDSIPFTIYRDGNDLRIEMSNGRVGIFAPTLSIADEVHEHLNSMGFAIDGNGDVDTMVARDGIVYRVIALRDTDSITVMVNGSHRDNVLTVAASDPGRRIAAFKRVIGPWLAGQ